MANTSVAILCPHVDDICGHHLRWVLSLGAELGRIGVPWAWVDVAHMPIVQARDRLARSYLSSPFTHALWMDSDNAVAPGVVAKMLAVDKDFVSAPSILRRPKDRPEQANDRVFNVVLEDFDQEPVNGAVRVKYTGFGTVLMRRRVVEILSAAAPKYMQGGDVISNVFAEFVEAETMTYHGEDFAFSARWGATGGAIWALLDAQTNHDGQICLRRSPRAGSCTRRSNARSPAASTSRAPKSDS
jgi:hypothetical protein